MVASPPRTNFDGGVFNPGDPFNPLVVHPAMILPASHPDNTFGVDRVLYYRAYELGNGHDTDNRVFRGLVGLQGSHYGWDWDTGLLYAESKLKTWFFGIINYDRMQAALNDGTYRITRPTRRARARQARTCWRTLRPCLNTKRRVPSPRSTSRPHAI